MNSAVRDVAMSHLDRWSSSSFESITCLKMEDHGTQSQDHFMRHEKFVGARGIPKAIEERIGKLRREGKILAHSPNISNTTVPGTAAPKRSGKIATKAKAEKYCRSGGEAEATCGAGDRQRLTEKHEKGERHTRTSNLHIEGLQIIYNTEKQTTYKASEPYNLKCSKKFPNKTPCCRFIIPQISKENRTTYHFSFISIYLRTYSHISNEGFPNRRHSLQRPRV